MCKWCIIFRRCRTWRTVKDTDVAMLNLIHFRRVMVDYSFVAHYQFFTCHTIGRCRAEPKSSTSDWMSVLSGEHDWLFSSRHQNVITFRVTYRKMCQIHTILSQLSCPRDRGFKLGKGNVNVRRTQRGCYFRASYTSENTGSCWQRIVLKMFIFVSLLRIKTDDLESLQAVIKKVGKEIREKGSYIRDYSVNM